MSGWHLIYHGDCIEVMKRLASNSIDAVVTDPPYGIRFKGVAWDGADIKRKVGERANGSPLSCDPKQGANGAHMSGAFEAGKYNRTAAGNIAFGEWSKMWAREALRVLKPGGHLLSFAAPRTYHWMAVGIECAGFEPRDQIMWIFGQGFPKSKKLNGGWGTALKPAHEPIMLARKPLDGLVTENVARLGTGGMNIEACRVPVCSGASQLGRFPANLIHDGSDDVTESFPEAAGQQGDLRGHTTSRQSPNGIFGGMRPALDHARREEESTSAARFFYCAKVRGSDRAGSNHPTVKPIALMRYLCRLVTPKGGIVLDPFGGSGTTGEAAVREGFNAILIEQEAEYVQDINRRMSTLSERDT